MSFVLHISEYNKSAKIIFGRYKALCIFSPFCPNNRTIKFDVSRRDERTHFRNPPYEKISILTFREFCLPGSYG